MQTIRNSVHLVSKEEVHQLNLPSNTYLVTLDGMTIQRENQLLERLTEAFQLPCCHNWDCLLDWLTDLDWLNATGFALLITDFEQFLMENPNIRGKFLEYLTQDVLPYWEKEVLYTCLGGVPKSFQLYLVL